MSNSSATRALADLEKQLVELSRLRNANTRDPDFKVWRQATLTLIQRIWEGDDSRSGRFRSVPFSPGTTRADPKLAREWFERGCAEAARVLRDLIEEINEHGIIKGPAAVMDEPEPLPDDESVPILSLDGNDRGPGTISIAGELDDLRLSEDDAAEDEDDDEDEIEIPDIPDPPGARPPKPVNRPMQKSAPRSAPQESPRAPAGKPAAAKSSPAPAPEAKAPASSKRAVEPQIPLSETAPPGPSRGVTVSNGGSVKGKKPPGKDRLKDMLGFEPGSQYTPPPPEQARPAAAPAERPRPAAAAPAPEKPAARPAPTTPARTPAPATRTSTPRREPPAPPADRERHTEHFGTIAPESVAPLGEGGDSDEFVPAPRPASASRPAQQRPAPQRPEPPREEPPREEPPREEPPPIIATRITPLPLGKPGRSAGPPDAKARPAPQPSEPELPYGYDENTLKRAFEAALQSLAKKRAEADGAPAPEPEVSEEPEAEDLLGNSPVFNVTARPIKRHGPESEGRYHTPTAIAMAAIATEVEALGVPGPNCGRTRAALFQLADHFERRDLTWDVVRDAVRLLVEYPVVARRVLPLLLPHLDEAA
ncbi:MAG: hypothetical protein ACRENS_09010 [Candidatus Eiseniibacteriota bacterium]